MATKQNFESESDPKIDQYGPMYLCAKFHTFNMDSPIISHIASAISQSSYQVYLLYSVASGGSSIALVARSLRQQSF